MKTNMKRALAVSALAVTGISGMGASLASASTWSGYASGNLSSGARCHGNVSWCGTTNNPSVKSTSGDLRVVADVSTQRHDRNFTLSVRDLTNGVMTNTKITANQGVMVFIVKGVPRGHRYAVVVDGWSAAPLDAGSGIYMRANG